MDELTQEYVILFNGITSTICELENTIVKLQVLQQKAEEAILERECESPKPADAATGDSVVLLDIESMSITE